MATKHDPDYGNDRYSEEETAKRRAATIRAMIGMAPKPHQSAIGTTFLSLGSSSCACRGPGARSS